MPTINEEFLDAILRHQIFLFRYGDSVRDEIVQLLKATERDVLDKIRARAFTGEVSPGVLRRLEVLRKSIAKIRAKSWVRVGDVWFRELQALAAEEAEFTAQLLRSVSPVQLDLLLPGSQQLRFIALERPFEGKILKSWADDLAARDIKRLGDQLKIGLVQGEASAVIARRARRVLDLSKRNAEAITRTAVNAISNSTKREVFQENSELFSEELYVATLDSRTTPICRSLDGKTFPIGEGPSPPLHINCRSVRVALFFGEAIGERPAKPTTTKILLKEFADAEGIDIARTRKGLPRGFRQKFDKFARGRIRQMVGPVPAKLSYGQWLKRQTVDFQNEVLGPTRGRLFRSGSLDLAGFVDRTGKQITLKELARLSPTAFRNAGFDPQDFLD